MKKIVVGILAHVDSGKTTLSEALLYLSGSIRRLGRVDHRDSFLDSFAVERKRGITVFSKQAILTCGDTVVTLLDTPGHADFSAEAERALQVMDYAVLVISGSDGVQSHTLTLWRLLERYRVPCFIFVNKMDLPGADRADLLRQMSEKLSDRCVDFTVQDTAALQESAALCDDALLSAYEEHGTLTDAQISAAIARRSLFPCCFGSALKLDGVEAFFQTLLRYTLMPRYHDRFGAKVFKLAQDPQGARLTYMKITGGTLRVRDVIDSPQNTDEQKVSQIRVYSGDKYTAVEEAEPGTVCAVTGISFARPGDGLGTESASALPLIEPVLRYRVILPEGVDTHTAYTRLQQLESEDPTMRISLSETRDEIYLRLMGEMQLEILQSVIEERFGYTVSFGEGAIIYKETIAEPVEGVGHYEPLRHYAEVHLLLQPGERGSGLVIRSRCREDDLDRNWQRLILTHLHEKTHRGVLTGAAITDIEILLMSGRAHPKHTEGGDFRQATYRAVRHGLRCARSILLEPVYAFTLEIPLGAVGRAMADITRMHGAFQPPEPHGDTAVITGTAPAACLRGYNREVTQYTRGTGRLTCALTGYEPCHNAEEVIAQSGYDPDADWENPCDSVFCSHGAGHTVKWNEVKTYMHLPSVMKAAKAPPIPPVERLSRAGRSKQDIFASDRELMKIFEQTYGPIKKRVSDTEPRHFTALKATDHPRKTARAKPLDTTEYVLVDGYNVIHAWDSLRPEKDGDIDGSRLALINILCNYQGYRKCELILVFDAYLVKGHHREIEQADGISIVYTKEAETADMYIEKTSHRLAREHRVRVVTSDRLEQLIIIGNGAVRVSSEEFYDEVQSIEQEIREIIQGGC